MSEKDKSVRPVLDWPDSEGFWWMLWFPEKSAQIVYAQQREEIVLLRIGNGFAHAQKDIQDARFVRLTETSPF